MFCSCSLSLGMRGTLIRKAAHSAKQGTRWPGHPQMGVVCRALAVQAPGEMSVMISWLFSIPYDLWDFPDTCVAVCNFFSG